LECCDRHDRKNGKAKAQSHVSSRICQAPNGANSSHVSRHFHAAAVKNEIFSNNRLADSAYARGKLDPPSNPARYTNDPAVPAPGDRKSD
jgi:hypothetical protein